MAITSTLGSFLITGNKIHVSDPCYDYACSGAVTLDNVLSGKYLATLVKHNLDIWDTRVCKLTIQHEDYKDIVPDIYSGHEIAVDSGQAGFFDDDYYQQNQGGDFGDINTLFGLACFLTLSKNQGGIMLNKGVVSETGFGDGCYSLFIAKNDDGKIVAASIIFITDEELEEY